MAVSLGKRKRSGATTEPGRESPNDSKSDERIQDIFRKAFEAKFKPLPVAERSKPEAAEEPEDADEDCESDWSGFSKAEELVPVIEHADAIVQAAPGDRHEAKAFTSSKPPSSMAAQIAKPKSAHGKPSPAAADDEDSTQNLKNDLALQRLLSESHLLSATASADVNPTGKTRHKALDMRLQSLGSKTSIFVQEKMPMSFRKGIDKKKRDREEKRRKEAKEAGIVLEAVERKKTAIGRRERAIGAPVVGKFKGGLLTLSKRDISEIQGSGGGIGGRGGGGRGRGGSKKRR